MPSRSKGTARRQRDPEATRTAILDAAEEIFAEKGFADAAVSEIARGADVTKSLIHHHFGSKEALWREVKRRKFADYEALQAALLASPSDDAEMLSRSLETYFQFLRRNPTYLRLVSWMQLEETGEDPFEPGEELFERGAEAIVRAQQQGEIRSDIHPIHILITMLGLCEHWFQTKELRCACQQATDQGQGAGTEDLEDDEAYLEAIQKIFVQGIRPR